MTAPVQHCCAAGSDAVLLRVYLVVKQCANLGRVRLPQAASPVAVVQFNVRSDGGFEM